MTGQQTWGLAITWFLCGPLFCCAQEEPAPVAQLDHLVRAAAHLEQAGLADRSAEIRNLVDEHDVAVRQQLLDRKLEELAELEAEIDQLRQSIRPSPQVLIRLQLLRFHSARLETLGLPLVSFRQLIDSSAGVPVVDESGKLQAFLQTLREQAAVQVLAEPAIVTRAGRPAIYVSGGRSGHATTGAEASPAEAAGSDFCGTYVRCLPTLIDHGRLAVDLEVRHGEAVCPAEPGEQNASPPEGESTPVKGPAADKQAITDQLPGEGQISGKTAIRTTLEITPGETIIVAGMSTRSSDGQESCLILTLKAELLATGS